MLRWGIIGVGDVCEKKSGPGFQLAEGSELVAVMRRSLDKAEDFARRHNVPKAYANAAELLADSDVDAVYIATPPGSHLEIARLVAAAGKPCYLEKPMARNAAESREIAAAFRAAKVPLFVAYYRRALPRNLRARQIVRSGDLGTITDVTYRFTSGKQASPAGNDAWRFQPAISGGGLVVDSGSHTIDLMDFLLGPLCDVQGRAAQANLDFGVQVEDTVTLSAVVRPDGAAGGTALLTASWNFASSEGGQPDWLVITGTKGTLRLTVADTNTPLELITCEGTQRIEFDPPSSIQQPMIQTVVNHIAGNGVCASLPDSAIRTAVVLDTVLGPFYGGRDGTFWERTDLGR